MSASIKTNQRGGFGVGLIIGLLIGLALALGVALYVTKVPVPFVNKVPQRSPAQDAAEVEKNKNWDPNSPLYGKNPARPSTVASGVVAPALPSVATAPTTAPTNASTTAPTTSTAPSTSPTTPVARASAPASTRDPAAILADRSGLPKPAVSGNASGDGSGTSAGTSVSTDRNGNSGSNTVSTASADPFTYFVQAGAYGTPEDAEQQRARLAMMGMEARLSEREQSGRTVHRVRLGPFDRKADADAAKDRLNGAGIEAALVRVQR